MTFDEFEQLGQTVKFDENEYKYELLAAWRAERNRIKEALPSDEEINKSANENFGQSPSEMMKRLGYIYGLKMERNRIQSILDDKMKRLGYIYGLKMERNRIQSILDDKEASK
jgi:hypothetical protein